MTALRLILRISVACLACFAAGILVGLLIAHRHVNAPSKTLSGETVSRVTVTSEAPLQALNKKELAQLDIIPHSALETPHSEVLAAGRVQDDSGTRHVAAVLDTKTGETTLTEKRPFAEWLSRDQLGLGWGYGSEGEVRAARYEHTFGRVWDLYASAEARVEADRNDNARWSGMLWLNYRW